MNHILCSTMSWLYQINKSKCSFSYLQKTTNPFLIIFVDNSFFDLRKSSKFPNIIPVNNLTICGSAARPPEDLKLKPTTSAMNFGTVLSWTYRPHKFPKWRMHSIQNGIDVNILVSGGFVWKLIKKIKFSLQYTRWIRILIVVAFFIF